MLECMVCSSGSCSIIHNVIEVDRFDMTPPQRVISNELSSPEIEHVWRKSGVTKYENPHLSKFSYPCASTALKYPYQGLGRHIVVSAFDQPT